MYDTMTDTRYHVWYIDGYYTDNLTHAILIAQIGASTYLMVFAITGWLHKLLYT